MINEVWPVGSVAPFSTAVLWARVTNTETATLPAGSRVWFFVDGPGIVDKWVGHTLAEGLPAGASVWYAFNWAVPGAATGGTYVYWAQVWTLAGAISPWSTGQTFIITP